ncbi:MAG: hypothetical protein IJE25_05460 [Clostridia bacterium]|nr:hypothetical protein [Clostridia bacterium]
MKRFISLILTLCTLLSALSLYSCFETEQNEEPKTEESTQPLNYVTNSAGEELPVMSFEQKAVKNADFLDTEVSWYDDAYNYYVYNVGKIKNVPLTSTYAVFYYNGGDYSLEREVTKATEKSISTSTEIAKTASVTTTLSGSSNVTIGVEAALGKIVSANVQKGYSFSVTNSTTNTTVWTDSYEECVSYSESQSDKLTLNFNSSCEKGYYMYLYLGDITVYYVVIQSKSDGKCYVETYDKIDNYKYVLNYSGSDDEFPINERANIEVDTAFIDSLKAPTKYIEGAKPELTYEPIVIEKYQDKVTTVESAHTHYWWLTIDAMDEYIAKGYNKINIEYSFYTTGGWSLFGGNVDIKGYLAPGTNTDNAIHSFTTPSSEDGKWISGSKATDLRWFAADEKIYLITCNENLTEDFTVSKLTIKVTITKE